MGSSEGLSARDAAGLPAGSPRRDVFRCSPAEQAVQAQAVQPCGATRALSARGAAAPPSPAETRPPDSHVSWGGCFPLGPAPLTSVTLSLLRVSESFFQNTSSSLPYKLLTFNPVKILV